MNCGFDGWGSLGSTEQPSDFKVIENPSVQHKALMSEERERNTMTGPQREEIEECSAEDMNWQAVTTKRSAKRKRKLDKKIGEKAKQARREQAVKEEIDAQVAAMKTYEEFYGLPK